MSRSSPSDAAATVAALSYTFAARSRPTLREISFRLAPATFTVVAGRTGSGKSTLLRALAGLIPHHSAGTMHGAVRLGDRDTRDLNPAALAATVGLVLQSPDDQLCTTTVESELAFGLENLNLPVDEIGRRIDDACRRFGLGGYRHTSVTRLSGGLKQRLLLAAVAAMRPQVLLCDEPLSQLDAATAHEFVDELVRLRDEGLTIVCAEHRLDEILPRADRLLVIDEGRLRGDVPLTAPSLATATLKQADLRPPEVWELEAALEQRAAPRVVARGANMLPPGEGARRADEGRAALSPIPRAPIVEIQDLAFRYPRGECDVWTNLNLSLRSGERVALVGGNGAGKSTLLGLLAGSLAPTSGRIAWRTGRAPQAALVPQQVDLTLFARTVADEVAYGPRQLKLAADELAKRTARAAELFNLADFLSEPPQALSQGERVRTALAAAYTMRPALLLLDEPTTGQDTAVVESLMAVLGRDVGADHAPAALLFSTHDLRIAVRYSERVLVAAEGRIIADLAPSELVDDVELLRRAAHHVPPVWEFRRKHRLTALDLAGLREELLRSASGGGGAST